MTRRSSRTPRASSSRSRHPTGSGCRGARPPHRLAARRGGRAGLDREDVARLMVLQEASRSTGVAGQILGSLVARDGFELLDARPCSSHRPTRPCRSHRSSRTRIIPSVATVAPEPGGAPCLLTARITPAVEAAGVPAEIKLELFRLMLLQRLTEERIIALYRQGRIVGHCLHRLAGRRPSRQAPGLALGPDDVVAPLNRELACHYARGVTVAEALPQLPRQGRRSDARTRRQHALRRAREGRLPARLDARRPRARSSSAPRSRSSGARAAGRDDLLGRRRDVDG